MSVPRRFRRPLAFAGLTVVITALLPAAAAPAAAATRVPPRGVAAAGAVLANPATGRVLWARAEYVRRPIASLTKVMTALVVTRTGDLGRHIRITQAEVNYVCCGIAGAGLRVGDVLTARQLLYAMLLPSGADAAMALAQTYGPGVPAFVRKMNATARKLHLPGTRFTNFDGVPSSDVSTPRNLITLGIAAMRQPAFRAAVRLRWYRLAATRLHHSYFWRNRNYLLSRYPGVIGIKTGWTPAAGECLLFEAVHGKRALIGVVLDSAPTDDGQIFAAAARMLNWGFGLHVRTIAARSPWQSPGVRAR
ncbi:MAG TPA: D-alanyl-D-alanine carboxypeptidase [Streptosporangiaceae bacterium]|nr:D-alanyl-D-alanine carboxypeptidase [Streptosporangiaceae bacterium]